MTKPNNERYELHHAAEALCDAEMDSVSGGATEQEVNQLLSALLWMRHEISKTILQNSRA